MVREKTFLYVIIALITLLLCTTTSTCVYKYKYDRLVEQHRQQLELARQRADVLTDTLKDIRTEVGAIGASLDRQRTSVSELRSLFREVKERYTKMENIISSIGDNDCDSGNINSSINNSGGGD